MNIAVCDMIMGTVIALGPLPIGLRSGWRLLASKTVGE